MKIYVVTETDIDGEVWVIKAFENADDATRFCKEQNRNTCHCFCMEETELEKSQKALDTESIRHGHWVKSEKSDYEWECSSCGYGLSNYRTTYCYDCGAKMDEEEENAEVN